jgi:type I restriction enzyme S subunit
MTFEWEKMTIDDVTTLVTKGTTPTSIGGGFSESGIPFVKVESISESGRLIPDKFAFIDSSTDELLRRSRIKHDDVLFSIAGTIGRVALVNKGHGQMNTNQAVALVRPDTSLIEPRFLYYSLRDTTRIQVAQSKVVQSVQANFSLGELKQLLIDLPPKTEQKAIAHILGTLDDKIELNRKTNETLEAIAKALFKSWFVDFDPVRAKAAGRPTGLPADISDLFPDSFEDSELGEIPSGWKVMGLGMVSTFLNGYAFKSSDWQEHGVPVVKIGSVKPGFVDVDNVSFVSDEIAASRERYRLSPGDILIGMTGYVGEVGLVPVSDSLPLLNQRVGKVAPMSEGVVSRSFLYNWMRTSTFKDSVEVLSQGSAQANVSSDSIQSILHTIPSRNIESVFASSCEPILDRLLEGHREQKILANIRNALLTKLISGEIRIPDAEKMLEEVSV